MNAPQPRTLTSADLDELPDGPQFFEQTWDLSYRHALGATVSRFLGALKAKRILARRCPLCRRVLAPARSFCDRCHCDTAEWVEVGRSGTIQMFTIVYEPFKGMPKPPYALAYVLLEGADTAVLGYVKEQDLSDVTASGLAVGAPVQVQFADHPAGKITDFWFVLDHRRLKSASGHSGTVE